MASAAMARASSSESPSVTRPGNAGHVTTYPPSAAGSKRTVYVNSRLANGSLQFEGIGSLHAHSRLYHPAGSKMGREVKVEVCVNGFSGSLA